MYTGIGKKTVEQMKSACVLKHFASILDIQLFLQFCLKIVGAKTIAPPYGSYSPDAIIVDRPY